jgi:hypothetical protein
LAQAGQIVKDGMMCVLEYSRTSKARQSGTVLIITIFIVALLSAVVMGILQVTTLDIQIMQNQVYAAEARMIAEAGLNDAVAQLRLDQDWDDGFSDEQFDGGTYSVALKKDEIESTGVSARGFTCVVTAGYTTFLSTPPHEVRLGALRINED